MHIQTKRSKTPTRATKISYTRKSTSPMNVSGQPCQDNARYNKQQSLGKQYRTKDQVRKGVDQLSYTIDRLKCESPALTASTTSGQPMNHRHDRIGSSKSDLEASLKIALELAEFHRKESQICKLKIEHSHYSNSMHVAKCECKCTHQVEELTHRNQYLERNAEKHEDKYNRLKQRYKELKSSIKSHQSKLVMSSNAQPPILIDQEGVICEMELEIQTKTKTIQRLCQQVTDYEQNSQNMLKIVSILQQKMQELNMENSLLRGMLRTRQDCSKANSTSNSRCQIKSNISDSRHAPKDISQLQPYCRQEGRLDMEDKGSSWDGVKLRRVYDTCEDQPQLV